MDRKKYISSLFQAKMNSRFLSILCLIIVFSNLILSLFVIFADTSEKTILIPFGMDRKFSIKGDEVDPVYIEEMANKVSQLLLTYQKENITYRFKQVLRLVDPSIYSEMSSRFKIEEKRIFQNDISSVFFPRSIHIEKTTAFISGEQTAYIGSQLVSRLPKTYRFDFKYQGELMFSGFKEVVKSKANSSVYENVKSRSPYMIDNRIIEETKNKDK